MVDSIVRVRFAPAPTGMMHIGNVRTALLNFLFARQKGGTCVLRIEDTDTERNYDPQATNIRSDLTWLSIEFDEGVDNHGPYSPYFQSQRTQIYQDMLEKLIQKGSVYRCFCTVDELEKKRARQIALKIPPRYDKTCLSKTTEEIELLIAKEIPFLWRFALDAQKKVVIQDIARGAVTFEYGNFSDFPLTRQDGSFTFIFANAIDDLLMEITHILRGEDHLSNTALQAAIFDAFDKQLPIYWHMPILCNIDGKKLSKRDFGFSLRELKDGGYLPEAIINYLVIIGSSPKKEIMSLAELIQYFNFDEIHGGSRIIYDNKKLEWMNHKWIQRTPTDMLVPVVRDFLKRSYGELVDTITDEMLNKKIEKIKPELKTIQDAVTAFQFYFYAPKITQETLSNVVSIDIWEKIKLLINPEQLCQDSLNTLKILKKELETKDIAMNDLYHTLRFIFIGNTKGPSIPDLIEFLGKEKSVQRLQNAILIN